MDTKKEITGILRESRKITIDRITRPTYLLTIGTGRKGAPTNVIYFGSLPEERLRDSQGTQVTFREIGLDNGEIAYDLETARLYRSTSRPYVSREEQERARQCFKEGKYRV